MLREVQLPVFSRFFSRPSASSNAAQFGVEFTCSRTGGRDVAFKFAEYFGGFLAPTLPASSLVIANFLSHRLKILA